MNRILFFVFNLKHSFNGVATVENDGHLPPKIKHISTTCSRNSTFGCQPRTESRNSDTCKLILKAALSTTAKGWKQARYPSIDEWIIRMWSIHTVEHYSAFQRNSDACYNIDEA